MRRVFVSQDTILPGSGHTEVDIRVSHKRVHDVAHEGVLEPDQIPSLARVYTGRSLLPERFLDIKVPVLNAAETSQVLPRGTELGAVEPADLLDDGSASAERVSEEMTYENEIESEFDLTEAELEVIEKMKANLPAELNDEQ